MAYPYYPYQPNYFSGTYQTPTLPQNNTQNGVNWVQGEAGARSWLTAPNSTVLLMDSESDKFYLKTTDASGMPQPLRVFEYRETTQNAKSGANQPQTVNSSNYVTKAEFDDLRGKVDALMKEADNE